MKKLTSIFVFLVLASLLMSSLIWAQQEEHHCQKAGRVKEHEESQSMMPMMQSMMMQGGMPCMKMCQGMMGQKGDPIEKGLRHLGCPDFFTRHTEELGLSEKQVADLKAIRWDQRKLAIKKKADIQVAHVEFEELLDREKADFGKVKAKITEIGDLEQDMRLSRLSSIQKAHKVLTTEQLEKAKTLKKIPGRRMKGSKKPLSKMKTKMKMLEEKEEKTK
jgi:hypothetical protein